MIGFIIFTIIVIILVVRLLNRNTKESIPRTKSTFEEFEKAGIFITDNPRAKEFDNKSKRTEEIYFDVIEVDVRSKSAKKAASELNMDDPLMLEVDFSKKNNRIKVYAEDKWIGFVEEEYVDDVKEVILYGNDNYECLVIGAFAEWDDEITDTGNIIEFVSDVEISAVLKYEKFEKSEIETPQKEERIITTVFTHGPSVDSTKSNFFEKYYKLYSELDYEDLKGALNVDNKDNYTDYTEEEKQRWRAVKVLIEEHESKEFRNYFVKKEFLKETDPGAIEFKMQQINFKESFQKMEAIPGEIKEEAQKFADELANKQLINKLKTKTLTQLENYMNKRGLASFSDQLQNYYYFRQHFMFNENRIKNDIKRIKDKSIRAKDEETMRATREDYHKLQNDLMWIMEGFFELTDEEQKHPPKKDFFKSRFLDNN